MMDALAFYIVRKLDNAPKGVDEQQAKIELNPCPGSK